MKRVYDQFLHILQTRCKAWDITNQMYLPSIRWVLAQTVIKLAPHVSLVCKVKREGTILYRSNGDIMHALSHSLAENKNHDCFTNVTNVLNSLLHEQAKGFLKRYKGHPETLSKMSLDNIVASIHPVFLSQLTQSKRQWQHRSLSHESVQCMLCVCYFSLSDPLPWGHNRTSYCSEQIWGSSISRHTQQIFTRPFYWP